MADQPAIDIRALVKSYRDVVALDGVDMQIEAGAVFGLLGPNGAGKTTLIRVLATLLEPTSGDAAIFGHPVVAESLAVRSLIGLAGQFAAVDAELTGRENLEMVARLYRLGRSEASRRAQELLERFGLMESAGRRVASYSGGMRRRLDLAAGLIGRPAVLLLDEPTTGLDPRSRHELWAMVAELGREGTTVLLTTQYLEEADRLSQQIAVLDRGRIAAQGTSSQLKAAVGGSVLRVRLAEARDLPKARAELAAIATGDQVQVDAAEGELRVAVLEPAASAEALRRLDAQRVTIASIEVSQPSLDDVFLALTGHSAVNQRGPQQHAEAA